MASYTFVIDALNDICVDNGDAGGHIYNINALNAWAVRLGGVGGHTFEINALNEIVGRYGGAGAPFQYSIGALNSISVALGGSSGYIYDIDALNAIAELSVPLAPILTWTSDSTVNPPQLDVDFDDTHIWPSGQITGSNLDRIELQVDQDPLFGSVDETDTNDLDAAELAAGTAQIFPGPLAGGVALYIRVRHHHYVNGVAHTSAWSNVETKTLVSNDDEDYAAWVAAAA